MSGITCWSDRRGRATRLPRNNPLFTPSRYESIMAGTQAPKGFGILFVFVGVPLIVWNAAGVSGELGALDASSSSSSARIEQCIANTAELLPDPSIRRQ